MIYSFGRFSCQNGAGLYRSVSLVLSAPGYVNFVRHVEGRKSHMYGKTPNYRYPVSLILQENSVFLEAKNFSWYIRRREFSFSLESWSAGRKFSCNTGRKKNQVFLERQITKGDVNKWMFHLNSAYND